MFDTTSTPALRYRTDTARFDRLVEEAFSDPSLGRRTRARLWDNIRLGVFDAHMPVNLPGFEQIDRATAERAMLNIVDFFFEPMVLSSMSHSQRLDYFLAIEASMSFEGQAGLTFGKPAVIETVHHSAIFSIAVSLARVLVTTEGKASMILLHQSDRPEPRLAQVAQALRVHLGMTLHFIPLKGAWCRSLVELATPTSAVFYLADMPPMAWPEGRNASRQRDLDLAPDRTGSTPVLTTLSVAARLSALLGADHIVMDFPDSNKIALTQAGTDPEPMRCPLEDWVFWPAVEKA